MTHFKYAFLFPEVKYPFKANSQHTDKHQQKRWLLHLEFYEK